MITFSIKCFFLSAYDGLRADSDSRESVQAEPAGEGTNLAGLLGLEKTALHRLQHCYRYAV